ncbi:unnamed protein product [Meganyctiphanes norvegica]|uniref:Uncharacterized protein n=1 Tax=Meganyctiphanes norvegica TaxID=48144 RepID=A0AAV2RLQ1_MEGNR
MTGRSVRPIYGRTKVQGDPQEEDAFLYCLCYYFDEARRGDKNEDAERRRRASRQVKEEEEMKHQGKKDDDDDECLNPLVHRERPGRPLRGGGLRRSYTPDRGASTSTSSAHQTSRSSRSHSQPPQGKPKCGFLFRRQRKKK